MTKRVLLLIPEALEFSLLSEEQQAAINSVFGQFVMPMPGTEIIGGFKICDALTTDSFNPDNMALYGLDWTIIGMWGWDGKGQIQELIAFDDVDFLSRLSPIREYDENGNVTSQSPALLHEPHRWSGWPGIEEMK